MIRFIICLALISAVPALADDFKTTKGEEYKGVTISRVEPDGLTVITSTGIVKLYFAELPKDVQEKYHYDPAAAASFGQQDIERQRALYNQAQADRKAVVEQVEAAARAEAQNRQTTTSKVVAQANQGLILRPGAMTAAQIAENPFSLRGYIVEMTDVANIEKREVAEGVYEVTLYTSDSHSLTAEMTAAQCNSVAAAGHMFVRVKPKERYAGSIPIEIVGTGVTYEGLSREPTFYWK